MRLPWQSAAPLVVGLGLALLPRPAGLTPAAWQYHALFGAIIVALVVEPIPAAAVGLVGITAVSVLGLVESDPGKSIKWGLSGFSDSTVWLIFGALVFSTGYEKTGLGRRLALTLVRFLGGSTLGLGYAVMLADLAIAPFTPSNTGRSAGVIFPVVRSIPILYGSSPGPTARRVGSYLMWTAFASTTVTSSLFLTALGPNLLAQDFVKHAAEITISWPEWLIGILPVGVLLIVPLPLLIYVIYPPEIRSSPEVPDWAARELARMGSPSVREAMMAVLALLAFVLWVFAASWISPTTSVLAVVSLMLLTGVITWDDLLGHRGAWDTLIYFATLVTLADGLNRVGVIPWAAAGVSARLAGSPPLVVMASLVAFFFIIHYLFASLTAHTAAVLPALLAAGLAVPGMPARPFVLLMMYSLGLMGVITPYATGPAPAYYGSGFIPRKDFWVLGFIFGTIFLATLLGVGMPYLLWLNS